MLSVTPAERLAMLKDGWKSVGRLFVIATVMDGIYQFFVRRWVYLNEAVVVAVILTIVPICWSEEPSIGSSGLRQIFSDAR